MDDKELKKQFHKDLVDVGVKAKSQADLQRAIDAALDKLIIAVRADEILKKG